MNYLLVALVSAVLALAVPSATYFAGKRSGKDVAQLRCAADVATTAAKARDQADQARQQELDARQETQREAHRMQSRALADAVAAERSLVGLRHSARQVTLDACAAAAPAAEPTGPPATPAGMVLADVLGWADSRAAEAAAALDAAYAAGTSCQREHAAALKPAPGAAKNLAPSAGP